MYLAVIVGDFSATFLCYTKPYQLKDNNVWRFVAFDPFSEVILNILTDENKIDPENHLFLQLLSSAVAESPPQVQPMHTLQWW